MWYIVPIILIRTPIIVLVLNNNNHYRHNFVVLFYTYTLSFFYFSGLYTTTIYNTIININTCNPIPHIIANILVFNNSLNHNFFANWFYTSMLQWVRKLYCPPNLADFFLSYSTQEGEIWEAGSMENAEGAWVVTDQLSDRQSNFSLAREKH